MKKHFKKITWLVGGTFLAMVPAYLIRFKESVYMFFYTTFSTYPGDLWNFFANYLGKGLHYPPEYPAGLRFFYELMGFYRYENYTWFFTVNTLIIGGFAAATTYILYLLLQDRIKNIWYFWILAPSFIFYGTVNYDIPVIFLIVLSVYLFSKEKYHWSIFWLAVGMVAKVFPAFLLPLFIWRSPARLRARLVLLFVATVVLLNLPYALGNFHAWIFPYIWQISSNLSTGPDQGTFWWIIYPLTGKLTGWLSLALYGGLYLFTCFKMRKAPFFDLCAAVVILFLLTDRIYSPQYTMYLLPFLALASVYINRKTFYSVEIANVLIVFFCFFLKHNPAYLQTLVMMRYAGLIFLLVALVKGAQSGKDSVSTDSFRATIKE